MSLTGGADQDTFICSGPNPVMSSKPFARRATFRTPDTLAGSPLREMRIAVAIRTFTVGWCPGGTREIPLENHECGGRSTAENFLFAEFPESV